MKKKKLGPFHLYPLTTDRASRVWNEPYLQIASFDPAEVNLGIRVERRYLLQQNVVGKTWRPDYQVTDKLANWVTTAEFQLKIEMLYYQKICIRGENETQTVLNINRLLIELMPYFWGCHLIIIERQLWKKNPDACKVFLQILHTLSIYLVESPLKPDILEVCAKWVKQQMSLQIGKKKGNKTIMPYRIRALLYFYGETASRQILSATGKKDDLADLVALIESVCRAICGLPALIDPGTKLDWSDLHVIKSYASFGALT